MSRWTTRQIINKRKEERKVQIIDMLFAGLFGIVIALCLIFSN